MVESRKSYISYEWGITWMILSAFCLSASFLFLKINLSFINYFFILFLRFSIPFACLVCFILIRKSWNVLFPSSIGLQLLRCLCVLVAQYGIAFYIDKNTLLNATVLLNTAPLFIPIIEWIFLKIRPGKSTAIGAILAFLGVILILQPDRNLFSLASGVGLLAALGQSGSQVLYGLRSKSENLLNTLFYLFLFTSLASFFIYLLAGANHQTTAILNWPILAAVLAMGITSLFNQYFRGLAYRCARPSTLAPFLYFSVLASALFDWLVFKKIPTTLTIIGSILIVLGGVMKIFLRSRILKKQQKK